MLMGLGFSPLAAAGLSLIANTAPWPTAPRHAIQGLASVTGLDPFLLGAMVGRQLRFFSLIVPFLADLDLRRFKGMKEICPPSWSPASPCGPQFLTPFRQSLDRRHRASLCRWLPDRFLKILAARDALAVAGAAQPRRLGGAPCPPTGLPTRRSRPRKCGRA